MNGLADSRAATCLWTLQKGGINALLPDARQPQSQTVVLSHHIHDHQLLEKNDKDIRSLGQIQPNLGPELRSLRHGFAHSRFGTCNL